MRRREVIAGLIGGVATWPLASRAQQYAMPVIGYLSNGWGDPGAPVLAAFRQALRETGYVEGQNVAIEYSWAEGSSDRLHTLAADLVSRKVDVIVSNGTVAARAAKEASSTIPIVVAGLAGIPVAGDLIASLARPGGNVTGISSLADQLDAKRLELLRELVPQARVIALLVNPGNSTTEAVMRDVQEAARLNGVQLQILKAGSESEIDAAFGSLVQRQAGAFVVQADPLFFNQRQQLVTMAARHAVPAIYGFREDATAGGLISYGASVTASYRQAGIYAARILKGAKPADLPVVQPTRYELVINLKTSQVLGLTIPPTLLARADEVIE